MADVLHLGNNVTIMAKEEVVSRHGFFGVPESRAKPFPPPGDHGVTGRETLIDMFVFFLSQVSIWPRGHRPIILSPPCM